ncbi:MAG: hypothetical protein ABIT09_12370 [Croceibacterium sp.]
MIYRDSDLFSRVSFDADVARRVEEARRRLAEDWLGYACLTGEEIINSLLFDTEIVPLQIDIDQNSICRSGDSFKLAVPWCGEPGLWQCFPVIPISGVRGQVRPSELHLYEEANSERQASANLEERLATIREILDQLRLQAEVYMDALPDLLQLEVAKAKYMHSRGLLTATPAFDQRRTSNSRGRPVVLRVVE